MLASSLYCNKSRVLLDGGRRGHLATVTSGIVFGRSLKKGVYSPETPTFMGPYSRAVKIHRIVFVSGQIGLDPRAMQLVRGGVKEQTQQWLADIQRKTATCSSQNSSSNMILLTEMAHLDLVSRVYGKFSSDTFAGHQGTEKGSP
ncbi:UNVERIFIED_CONTAM: endoribonuclease L-PSP protein [Hammondia hammondi]|eukprot:XP_008885099.1 endoribonuclease L-PSP protein [Hammondia hammondi]